ncbi:fumarylacetoacetase [Agrobacterium sp. LAD9]|uniref:fumarylacetoacetase n=1 Tax=Agrobacterium sp. LAD9 TaxID=2055153 RepID=UPI000D1E03B4|nr:fumarylacetoacetase [Agrobacterium sp. LAD9]
MNIAPNETHDPQHESWIPSANVEGCAFPLQNLPFGVALNEDQGSSAIVVAIGDYALDLSLCAKEGLLDDLFAGEARSVLSQSNLNALMGRSYRDWHELRLWLHRRLRLDWPTRTSLERCLKERRTISMVVPSMIGDYTDFYTSIDHATNVGKLFRPDNPLFSNFKSLPVGYHGRSSSICISGTPVRRPSGQQCLDTGIVFGPCRMLDFELELGAFVGGPVNHGPLPLAEAAQRLFGFCLVNDWSARDIQAWEYQPLGPFLSKSFATTLSPWIVTAEAVAPFRVPARPRDDGDPAMLSYLVDQRDAEKGALDIQLSVALGVAGSDVHTVTRTNASGLYWTFAQMMTHHMSNGCNMRPGDLIASGTISGTGQGEQGSLLELTRRGDEPIRVGDDGTRAFLQDGDEVVLTARCERSGVRSIGFGECRGIVLPAI